MNTVNFNSILDIHKSFYLYSTHEGDGGHEGEGGLGGRGRAEGRVRV